MHFDDLQLHALSFYFQCACCALYLLPYLCALPSVLPVCLTFCPTCSPIILSVTQDGSTALRTATLQGELAILKLLVQKGADVDATYPVSWMDSCYYSHLFTYSNSDNYKEISVL